MKLITTNFVKCASKSCDSASTAFPLHYVDCELVQSPQDFNADFVTHMLERLDWEALREVAKDLGNEELPVQKPSNIDPIMEENQALLKDLHTFLIETQIVEGKMICQNCKHTFFIKNSIPNFLLPPHLC